MITTRQAPSLKRAHADPSTGPTLSQASHLGLWHGPMDMFRSRSRVVRFATSTRKSVDKAKRGVLALAQICPDYQYGPNDRLPCARSRLRGIAEMRRFKYGSGSTYQIRPFRELCGYAEISRAIVR
jgi:hypothetical protein